MGRYHAILFDMDGTLLDTLTDMQDAVNHVLAAHGLPLRTLEEVRRFVGNGAGPLIHRALPEGYPQEQKVLAEYRAYYQAHNSISPSQKFGMETPNRAPTMEMLSTAEY